MDVELEVELTGVVVVTFPDPLDEYAAGGGGEGRVIANVNIGYRAGAAI